MLPENQEAKSLYIEMRDMRNRHRQMMLKTLHGDQGEFESWIMESIVRESEMASFQEIVDFATAEGILSPELIDAASSAVAWGAELRRLVSERVAA